MSVKQEIVERRRAWVAALRSGDYKQGSGWLRVDSRPNRVVHCCLGVGCELIDDQWVRAPRRTTNVGGIKGSTPDGLQAWRRSGGTSAMPQSALSMYAMTSEQADDLAAMNDTGSTFVEIADLLELWWGPQFDGYGPVDPEAERWAER